MLFNILSSVSQIPVCRVEAENKGMDKNIEQRACDPQQNDGMYLFQLHDSKEF